MAPHTTSPAGDSLRILMVAPTSFFADYGCHVRILEEVRALQARGHQVRVCTYHNGSDVSGIDIHRSLDVPWLRRAEVGSSRHKIYLDIALTVATLRQAIRFKPDVIHGHLHEGAMIGAFAARLLSRPIVFDYQGSLTEEMLDHRFIRPGGLRERVMRRIERFIDRRPDHIVTSGEPGASYLRKRGLPGDSITTVPDGIDVRRLQARDISAARAATRERLGIPAGAPVAVYLGLLADYQGTSLLIDAARLLLKRRPDMFVVIAGYPGADLYKQKAQELGIGDRVLFPGRIPYDQAAELLAAGDVAVAPKLSLTESNGKLLNYMALGLPVVAFDTPANRAILGALGHLVPPGDVAAFADEIELALTEPQEVRAALRARVQQEFSWERRIVDLESIYQRVLGRDVAVADEVQPPRTVASVAAED